MEVEESKVHINLPIEQPLYSPPLIQELISMIELEDEQEIDTSGLFNLVYIDKARLYKAIESGLMKNEQIRLDELLEKTPPDGTSRTTHLPPYS